MTHGAQVHEIARLRELYEALAKFGYQAQGALDAAAQEIQHAFDWLDRQLALWQRQVLKCQEDVGRARADLSRVRMLHDGQRVGGSDQEIALMRARQRLREAEEKVETVKKWKRFLPDAVREFEGPSRRLAGRLQADLRQGLALLQAKSGALEKYAATAPPSLADAPPPAPPPPEEPT
jgi:chromosome segregation ATPase